MESKRRVSEVLIPVSLGELIDKITILEIKNRNILDTKKRYNVKLECKKLLDIFNSLGEREACSRTASHCPTARYCP